MIGDEAADGKAPGAHFVDSRSVRQEAERDGEGGLGMSAKKTDTAAVTISAEEQKEIDRANEAGKRPVGFVHGLWLLPNSWDRWAELFEQSGYVAVRPEWP